MSRRPENPPEEPAEETAPAPERPARERRVAASPPEEPTATVAPARDAGRPAPQPVPPDPEPAPSPEPENGPRSVVRDKRIGIIGAGAMGSALCRGLVSAGAAPPNRVIVSDPHTAHVASLHQSLGVKVAADNAQVARYTDIVVLAIKPFSVTEVLEEIRDTLRRDDGKPLPLVISIAAGVRIETLESLLPENTPVVRAMPNTPAQVNRGACAYSRGTHADAAHLEQAAEIFRSVGTAVEVPERMLDAVTALSGSGPAYVYLMIEALVDGGVKVGLPRDIASQLAAQTVLGAAQMVIETGMHPAQLRDLVTTPAGTTIAAIAALEHSGLRAALIDAVEKAAHRARELG